MDIIELSFVVLVAMLYIMYYAPAMYWELTCVEPEPGYAQRLLHFFIGTEIKKLCPKPIFFTWNIGKDIYNAVVSAITNVMIGWILRCFGKFVHKRLFLVVSRILKWKLHTPHCSYCGTSPCQVDRRRFWKPSEPRPRVRANLVERSNVMKRFSRELELCVEMTNELPQDYTYWVRKFCQRFGEEQLILFPLCIQRQINYWYPLPHLR
ncbi:uncharacterized protein LOC117342650 [Pecten maximus]|uniref:uncharacterized protein LOC117342650 n=1 Tax=Pecten maximus TaxID=6579 RepID=UPI0014591872|nr:uncharacterized protein LOC117342650 [Pecten maximus]